MQTVSIIREKFMKKIIVTFIATITAALLLCFSVSAFDNNDYGGGGGYDFGGGDYGGGYDYGGNDYDSSSYSGDTDPVSVIIGIGIVVVIIIISTIGGNKKKARYLLGVPGHYYSSEKYMATMFGFPNFVLSRRQPVGDGRFGYWYTDLRIR